jgi:hypothetical protein
MRMDEQRNEAGEIIKQGADYYLKADELPVPHPDLPLSAAVLPRVAVADV